MYLQSKHRVQTRHFDRNRPYLLHLFSVTVKTVFLGILAGFLPAFLTVWGEEADR